MFDFFMKKFVGNNELIIHNISLLLTKIKLHYEDEASLKKRNIDSPHTFFYSVKFWVVVFLGVFFIEGGRVSVFKAFIFVFLS